MVELLFSIAACIAFILLMEIKGRKAEMKKMAISDELSNFLHIVYTTHDMKDMEIIYTLKAAILNNAMKVMDITEMAKRMDDAINNQLVMISDVMVKAGRY